MFFDIFSSLCKARGISCKRAAFEIGLSNSTPTKWKQSGATPTGETLNKIASYFGVTTDYLLNGEQKEKPSAENGEELAFSDMELLAAYKSADEVTQELIRRALGL